MDNIADLTPDQLEAILGTDYEVVLADALRQKAEAEGRANTRKQLGQVGNGNVFLDPAGAIENVLNRRRATKEAEAAQGRIDTALEGQKAGRRVYAGALLGAPSQSPAGAPRTVDSTIPGQTPPPAPGAPPAPLQTAMGMSPERLQAAGTPSHVQALIAKLRGR